MNVVRNLVIATIAAVVLTALLIAIFLGEAERMHRATLAQKGDSIARGAMLYDSYCSGCHGKRGEGLAGIYPPLNTDALWEGREDIAFYGTLHDYIALNISAGHPKQNMPSWSDDYGGPLRNDQVEDLVQFVMNWQGPQPPGVRPGEEIVASPTPAPEATAESAAGAAGPGDPERGQSLFAEKCASCHNADAQGGTLGPSLVRPELAAEDDDFFRETIINGRPGTAMPPWDGVLSAQDVEDIIAWLRTIQ
ncbi:MAG TPA: c-type cytochrome [Anaerolineae bacterium]|nr:c-type cytochrome [Anaerolineae bacterium]